MDGRKKTTVGTYLADRLYEVGAQHIFGVPGDYVLEFFECLEDSKVEVVTNCNELNAGYAADAYARIKGVGAVCVTYGVGGLSLCNATMGSFAERVPVITISGGPPTPEIKYKHLLHHTIGDMKRQFEIYQKATAFSVILTDPAQAPDQIDEAIKTCYASKRPVYIEIPRDLAWAPCRRPKPIKLEPEIKSDKEALYEAVDEAAAMLNKSKRPVVLLGVELHRFGLRRQAKDFISATGYDFVTTLLGKSIIPEEHPRFVGIYGGAAGWDSARKIVERSDATIGLGALMTDIHVGTRTSFADPGKMITVNSDRVRIKNHVYNNVSLMDFMAALKKKLKKKREPAFKRIYPLGDSKKTFKVKPDDKMTHRRFYQRLNRFIADNNIMIAGTGDSTFSAAELYLPKKAEFICQAFYLSIGYAVPAALGVKMAAPKRRPITVVGDGAFQVTAQEVSTMCRHRQNPVIFLINNDGYTIERVLIDGKFNDLNMWKYHKLPEVFGWGWGCKVTTEGELEDALKRALGESNKLAFIEIVLDKMDCCPGLLNYGEAYRKKIPKMRKLWAKKK